MTTCPFCNRAIREHERVDHEVLGWERERKQGGTNALRLRARTGAVAHPLCVDRAVHGLTGQQTLL